MPTLHTGPTCLRHENTGKTGVSSIPGQPRRPPLGDEDRGSRIERIEEARREGKATPPGPPLQRGEGRAVGPRCEKRADAGGTPRLLGPSRLLALRRVQHADRPPAAEAAPVAEVGDVDSA